MGTSALVQCCLAFYIEWQYKCKRHHYDPYNTPLVLYAVCNYLSQRSITQITINNAVKDNNSFPRISGEY